MTETEKLLLEKRAQYSTLGKEIELLEERMRAEFNTNNLNWLIMVLRTLPEELFLIRDQLSIFPDCEIPFPPKFNMTIDGTRGTFYVVVEDICAFRILFKFEHNEIKEIHITPVFRDLRSSFFEQPDPKAVAKWLHSYNIKFDPISEEEIFYGEISKELKLLETLDCEENNIT